MVDWVTVSCKLSFFTKLHKGPGPLCAPPTFIAALDERLVDLMLSSMLKYVEKTQVDSIRLIDQYVYQRLSGLD